jgi:iron complex transport system ATP-binding protein
MNVPDLQIRDLTVRYGERLALNEVSLDFPAGSFVAVLGPNGAGKSTLVRALTRLVTPAAGEVRCGERALRQWGTAELARTIAVAPQDVWAPFEYSVLEMVLMGRSPHLGGMGLESDADVALARRALARLELSDVDSRPIQTLSGGERQRVLLARVLAQDAPVVILDEPTAHLDIAHQQRTLELMAELNGEGRTVIVVLHDLNLASLYCPRLVLLAGGRVSGDGAPEEVLTEERLSDIYGAEVLVSRHPQTGGPIVLPSLDRTYVPPRG